MPYPRPAPIAGSVSPYVLECRMLKAYNRLLRNCDLDQLITDAFGPKLSPSKAAAADERLEYAIPELIQKLAPDQQAPIAALLVSEAPDLAAAVRELVKLENGLWRRDDDPRLRINDDARMKAAGMGHLSKAIYGNTKLGPPLVLEPLVVRKPVQLRTKKRRVARHRAVFYWPGQYEIWPPVSGGGAHAGIS